jgi:glycosyltransferase A (GT-A) superfamily protein (DUF2064 family)
MDGPGLLTRTRGSVGVSRDIARSLTTAFLEDITLTAQSLPPQSGIRYAVDRQAPPVEDSGAHLKEIFRSSLAAGATAVCVISTLSPHLPAAYILEAFGRLAQHPGAVVVGPTSTGSCYLVGVSNVTPESSLKDISWGKPNVLKETLLRAVTSELSLSLLPSILRVETSDHLKELSRDFHRGVAVAPHTQSTIRNLPLV